MVMMTHQEYDVLLQKKGLRKKSFFSKGFGNILLDRKYMGVQKDSIRAAMTYANAQMSFYKYRDGSADCDNNAFLFVAFMMVWFIKNEPRTDGTARTFGIVIGTWDGGGHAWVYAITDDNEMMFFNYGREKYPTRYSVLGSFTC